MRTRAKVLPPAQIEGLVHLLRGQRVMLDFDLAVLYGVETRVLNQAVKRNRERFPADFMFQFSGEEMDLLARTRVVNASGNSSQSVMSPAEKSQNGPKNAGLASGNPSQIVMGSQKHRNSIDRYYVFTEQGVAMLSSVLRSPRAVQVNIEIMRTFIRIRQWLSSNAELSRKLADLEKKYDDQFTLVFQAIRDLMDEKTVAGPPGEIGFHTIRAPATPQANSKTRVNRKST